MQSVYMCMNVGVDVLVSPSNGMLVRNLSKQKRKETTQKTTNGFQCKCVCFFVCAGLSVCVCVFMYCVYLYVCMYVYTYICVNGCLSQSAIANKSDDDCCSVLQYGVAACCNMEQRVCSVVQRNQRSPTSQTMIVAACCSMEQRVCSVVQRVAAPIANKSDDVCCSVLQCGTVCCSALQRVAACCSVLQCIAVHCSM